MPVIKSVLAVFLFVLFVAGQTARAQAIVSAKDLPNFGQVGAKLYRGGQPTEAGVRELAQMGVKTIIDLRGTGEQERAEELWARKNGLKFINVSLSNWYKPKTADIEQIIKNIAASEDQPVFVHCRRGADRTGTVIAVYRISQDGWTAQAALDEAKKYKIGWWQFWMKDYIDDYYKNFRRKQP